MEEKNSYLKNKPTEDTTETYIGNNFDFKQDQVWPQTKNTPPTIASSSNPLEDPGTTISTVLGSEKKQQQEIAKPQKPYRITIRASRIDDKS